MVSMVEPITKISPLISGQFKMLNSVLRPRTTARHNVIQKACFALWDKPYPGEEICLEDEEKVLVPVKNTCRFANAALVKTGVKEEYARQVANVLAMADFKGHYAHGLNRLPMFVSDIKTGAVEANAEPQVVKEGCSTAVICGLNGLGPIIGNMAMKLAIAKAKNTGISLIACNRSNYFGMASWYTDQALQCGLLGFAFSNAPPAVVPTGAKQKALGCNPISFAAPGKNNDAFVMDISTTSVSMAKINMHSMKDMPIPFGWGLGPEGNTTLNPKVVLENGSVTPLGSSQFGHKGYALGLMVETMTGILADALYGPFIRKWGNRDEEANFAHSFLCISPEFFPPNFQDRLSCLMDYLRKMEPKNPAHPVQIPGDQERANMKTQDELGGVQYTRKQLEVLDTLAKELGIDPLKPK